MADSKFVYDTCVSLMVITPDPTVFRHVLANFDTEDLDRIRIVAAALSAIAADVADANSPSS